MEQSVWKDHAVVAAASQLPGIIPLQLNTDSEGGQQFAQMFPVEGTPCLQFISPPSGQQPGGRVVKVVEKASLQAGDVASAISDALAECSRSRDAEAQAAALAALLTAAAATVSTAGVAELAAVGQAAGDMQVEAAVDGCDAGIANPANMSAAQAGGTSAKMSEEERKEKVAAAAEGAQQKKRDQEAKAGVMEAAKTSVEHKHESLSAKRRASEKRKLEDAADRQAPTAGEGQADDGAQRCTDKAAQAPRTAPTPGPAPQGAVAGAGQGAGTRLHNAGDAASECVPAGRGVNGGTGVEGKADGGAGAGAAPALQAVSALQFRLLDGSTFRCQVSCHQHAPDFFCMVMSLCGGEDGGGQVQLENLCCCKSLV